MSMDDTRGVGVHDLQRAVVVAILVSATSTVGVLASRDSQQSCWNLQTTTTSTSPQQHSHTHRHIHAPMRTCRVVVPRTSAGSDRGRRSADREWQSRPPVSEGHLNRVHGTHDQMEPHTRSHTDTHQHTNTYTVTHTNTHTHRHTPHTQTHQHTPTHTHTHTHQHI